MSIKIISAGLVGLDSEPIEIESDVSNGLPAFVIVGLPDAAVQEARERVKTALRNNGLSFPRTRLTVNLAPADQRKAGPAFDLPIAVSIAAGAGDLDTERLRGSVFVGELSLDGSVRPVAGALSAALMARRLGIPKVYVPPDNAAEASLIDGIEVYAPKSLHELIEHLRGETPLTAVGGSDATRTVVRPYQFDFADIAGLESAKRALEIAAAGGHNILMSGSPGSGKTLLARALPSILPAMTREESLEVTKIYSVARLLPKHSALMTERPWRSPHHTASAAAVIGGGTDPHPGEVTLAHRGVLFLDEFPEFPRPVLEGLRQPLEDKEVTVSRSSGCLKFPANFMLVAARNPCPCGYYGDRERQCSCPPGALQRYQKKISGPLLDRIDIHIEVPRTPFEKLAGAAPAEPSAAVRGRVERARAAQAARGRDFGIVSNADIGVKHLKKLCRIPAEAEKMLLEASTKLHLSPRALHRSIKVARTIADLDGRESIEPRDAAEALQYRPKQE